MQWPPFKSFLSTCFTVDKDNFTALEIRDANLNNGFFYFFDTERNHLVTDFILEERQQVVTLCHVTLINIDGKYTPRLRLWKADKTKMASPGIDTQVDIEKTPRLRVVKAWVDTNSCYENFWKVVSFLNSVADIELELDRFRLTSSDDAELLSLLEGKDKGSVLSALKTTLGDALTEGDIAMLAGRKEKLSHFDKLLHDSAFFAAEKERLQKRGDEAVWQDFFESNRWIFGYGLSLLACDGLSDEKLEQITTGASLFDGGGKRSDAVMISRGFISSLLFCEIKTPTTPLLAAAQYRPPDVYRVSTDLSGGVSQVQKTVHRATRTLASYIDKLYKDDGVPLRVELSTVRPRQVLLIGHQSQLSDNGDINLEKSLSFELYRKAINDVEILTFDELFERAKFIIGD